LGAWVTVLSCLTVAQTRVYDGREPLYRHVLVHDPKSFAAANNLGAFYADSKSLVEAQVLLEAAVENARFDRQKGLALWNLCLVASVKGDDRGLLARAREAYSLVPTKASRSMLALGLVRNGLVDEAAAMLEDSPGERAETRVSGEHVRSAYNLAKAEVAEARGNRAEARKQLELVMRETPTACMRLQAGIDFARLGIGDEASKVFGSLRDHPVLGGHAYLNLGLIALDRGNAEVAEACYKAAADRDATLVEPYVGLARIYGREKRFTQAELCLVEALRRAPDDQALVESLEKIRAEQTASMKNHEP
jgi:tetratricopeptide (TPR) repeat protein